MEVRNLTEIEDELMDRLIEIYDDKKFVCGVMQDCYDDEGRQEMLDYLNKTKQTDRYKISFKAIQIHFSRKYGKQ